MISKKIYFLIIIYVVMTVVSCDSGDTKGGSDTTPESVTSVLDIVVANDNNTTNYTYFNNGDLTFTQSDLLHDQYDSQDIALGDLDNDGDLDAFVANKENKINSEGNRVYLNDGQGNLIDTSQSLGTYFSYSVALGDLDNDGDLDAFVANFDVDEPSKIWLNDGNGYFTDSGQNLYAFGAYSVILADFDNDNDLDAFVALYSYSDANIVFLNNGSGVFSPVSQTFNDKGSYDVVAGDVDNDNDIDIIVTNIGRFSQYGENELWLNNGDGTFTVSTQDLGSFGRGLKLGDLDGDSDLDLIIIQDGNNVYLNDGSGNFISTGQNIQLSDGNCYANDVALGDLDNDGDLDAYFAWKSRDNSGYPNQLWLNDGSGFFSDSGLGFGHDDSISVVIGKLR